jgi:hypothetical protein
LNDFWTPVGGFGSLGFSCFGRVDGTIFFIEAYLGMAGFELLFNFAEGLLHSPNEGLAV